MPQYASGFSSPTPAASKHCGRHIWYSSYGQHRSQPVTRRVRSSSSDACQLVLGARASAMCKKLVTLLYVYIPKRKKDDLFCPLSEQTSRDRYALITAVTSALTTRARMIKVRDPIPRIWTACPPPAVAGSAQHRRTQGRRARTKADALCLRRALGH